MASSDIPMQIAETVQTAHINREPSAAHDINPSTAADTREPVQLDERKVEDEDEDDIPTSVLRPLKRFDHLPPLPDLRFEQSYLHSIKDAKSWWMVAYITTKDQLMMPLIQGIAYNLLWCGWERWNRNAQLTGNSIGARARRWWYGVNNWPIDGKPVTQNGKGWFQR
ncbi:hypothetical protein N0V93_005628 [Gnomoniopsis smithogilvyi]|uniref:DUF1770-domain-containing protein n=1 Tax=Gnomoniopsis smithogilvyi TaxID=1191159 RepID=A0A9W8YUR5_9PEZI|nr:hypothetical protein N0V93_005628 [Gnomoniopsis smithogilvyi]